MIIRVMIADDFIDALLGLERIISSADDMELVGRVSDVFEILTVVEASQPDVLVLDLAWPQDKQAGIHLLSKIRKICPKTQIVAITAFPELVAPAQAKNIPGVFVRPKGYTIAELLSSIRWAHETRDVITETPTEAASPTVPAFTPRELQVLKELTQGRTDKEIANTLHIAEGTVNKYLTIIFQKLGVSNRTEATGVAFRKKLI